MAELNESPLTGPAQPSVVTHLAPDDNRHHRSQRASHLDAVWLARHVTVVVTTSPARSDPELDLLRATLTSLQHGGLHLCPVVLVCDKFSAGVPKGGARTGVCTADQLAK
jgi:hypothetical protein